MPDDPDAYSQDSSAVDIYLFFKHLGIGQAYIGELSIGGTVAVSCGMAHPEMCRAVIVAVTATNREDLIS